MAGVVVHPSAVELQDLQPGSPYAIPITIKNQSAHVRTIRARPPKSPYFSIHGFPQAQKLPPGLEVTFQVLVHGEQLTDMKQLVSDKVVIQTELGEYELPLKVLTPKPDVHIEGDLMYGLIPVDSKASKTFKIINKGTAPAEFKLDWDRASGMVLVPASGQLDAVNSGTGLHEVEVTASLTVQDPGGASGEVTVLVGQGATEGHKIGFSATVVKQSFELLDGSNTRVTEMDFSTLFFGDAAKRTVTLFNNGPLPAKYRISYGNAAEMKAKLSNEEGGGDDPDEPYADIIAATHQTIRSKATNDNPFNLTPLAGSIAPYSKTTVVVSFKPKDVPNRKGFQATLPCSDATTRIFDFLAVVEFPGCPASTRLVCPLRGKGQAAALVAEPPAVPFGDVATYDYGDQLVTLRNTSETLALRFALSSKTPYFQMQPPTGSILPGQTYQVMLRYMPQAMGSHQGSVTLDVTSENSDLVLQQLKIQVAGTCLRAGHKGQLVGGTDKGPKDFVKPSQYVSPDQLVQSVMLSHKPSSKGTTPFWDQPDLQQAFADIGLTGNEHAYSKDEFVNAKQHKQKYISAMREGLTERQRKARNAHVDDSDVNLGMDTRSGLKPLEPQLPGQPEPLWTLSSMEGAQPKQQRTVTAAQLAGIPTHKDRPTTESEQQACAKELDKSQISKLVIGPKVVDFGAVSVGSTAVQHLLMVNTLDQPIHVVLDLKAVPELRGSKHSAQVIPPGQRASFPLTLVASDIKNISEKVDYCINGNHCLSFSVAARVVPVTVDLSSEEVQFEFSLDDWEHHLERLVQVSNPHKFPVEFSLACSAPQAFTCTPTEGVIKPQSAIDLLIRWTLPPELSTPPAPPKKGNQKKQGDAKPVAEPALGGPQLSGVQEATVVLNLLGGDQPRRIALQGQIPEVGLRFKDKQLDGGQVPLFTPQTVTAQLKNIGTHSAAFKVLPNPLLQVTPEKQRISPDETVELQVTYNLPHAGPLNTVLEVQVQGGHILKLPVKSEGVLPLVEVKQSSFDFGPVYLGSFAKLPFTLVNTTPVPAKLMVDMLKIPDLQLTIAKDAWNASEYEECPLQRIGAYGEIQTVGSQRGSTSGSGRSTRRSSSINAMGFTGATGYKFTINMNPSSTLELQMVYKAESAGPQNWEISLASLTSNCIAPVARAVTADGVNPRIIISKTSVDFGVQTVIRSNQVKPPYTQVVYFTNRENEAVDVRLGPCAGRDAGVFALDTNQLTIQPGEMTPVTVQFIPRDGTTYESRLPVYLNGDAEPYIQMEVVGQGQHPRLTFDVRECILPVVPLGVKSSATFHVVNVNYDNLELRYRLPADESHQPLSLEFPEGNLIGVARERLPVVVTFESSRPVSFTANIDFMDEDGKRYSIPVSAAADNCLISHQPFLQANEGLVIEAPDTDSPVVLKVDDKTPYTLPPPSSALGPSSPIHGIVRYLNAASGRGPYDAQLHSHLVGSRGKLFTELIELLSGKSLPGKVAKLSTNRKEAAEQLLGAFDAALTFLRSHGALLNAVKPEMLLDVDDYNRVLTARMTKAEDDPDASESLALWEEVRESFELYSVQAWNAVMSQMFKVFVLGRVTLKAFRALPGMSESAHSQGTTSEPASPVSGGGAKAAAPAALHLKDSAILGSNLYSPAEGCLLAWATAHYAREFGSRATRLTNFDEDFRDGLALFSLLSGYWPAYSAKKSSMRSGAALTPAECTDNAEMVIRLMAELGLPYELTAKDICEPDGREMLVLLVYLFQVLPQFVPKSTIDFNCRLGETQVKELELSNPSRKGIAYTVRLEGHPDFSVDATVARIDAQGVTRLPCKCTPTTSLAQTARLVLMSKRDGGAYAATMVFLLRAVINTRAPLKRVRTEGPLYEMQQFEFTLTNPFKTDCDFSIQLLHEPAEPLPAASDDKKGKKKAPGKPAAGKPSNSGTGQQAAASTLYPNAFGLDRSRLRLKANGSEKLRASFLPFYMGTHYCTVLIKDKEQGEFTYELVGETLLPPPCMEFKGVIPMEGPNHTFDLCIPLSNAQLEAAKRTFLEKHPLAKDRAQAGLLKTDPFKGLSETTYTLSQTNSLMTCPDTLVLNASAVPPVPITKGGPPPGKKDDPVPPGILRVGLKPVGLGIYPSRLLLTNTAGLDTRVVDLELTAQVMTQQFDLIFDCAARQSISQDIPLVNASDQYMVVQAELLGGSKAFSGGKDITVPPSSTAAYHLTFKPLTPGDHPATLELSIPSTGEKNTYRLIGRATEPVAESHIVLECQARSPVTKTIAVPNIVGGSVEYQVLSSLSCVAGPATIKVTGSQATSYKLTAAPVRSGTYVGSLTLKTPDGQYVWFSVEVRASEPPEVGVIDVEAQVRKAVSIQLSATNPTQDHITLDVRYSHPDCLLGPATVSMPPASQGPVQLEFYYAPLIPGSQQGSITLVSKELGEFWYQLRMTALPAPANQLPALTARLGDSASTRIRVANPLDRPTTVSASFSPLAPCFSLSPQVLQLGPESEGFVELTYTPVGLGHEDSARVVLESEDIGTSEYVVQGVAEVPDCMPATTLYGKPGVTNWTAISWHNPFPAGVTASVSVHGADEGEVVLTKTSASTRASSSGKALSSKESSTASFGSSTHERPVASSGTLQIPLEYRTRLGQPVTAEIHVAVQQSRDSSTPGVLLWRYPLVLVPEDVSDSVGVTSTFRFNCKVQETVQEVMEVVLRGLGSVPQEGESFQHEVIIPPQHVVNLGPAAFSITPHGANRITSPEQPLSYLVKFTPQVAVDVTVTLVVSKPSGGRWRFAVELKADTQETQGVITLETAMDTTCRAGVPLYSSSTEPQPFTAWLSSDTPLTFDVQPVKGMLPVKPSDDAAVGEYLTAQQHSRRSPPRLHGNTATPPAASSQPSHLVVSYTCRAFNKVVKGTLYVQTPDGLHTFELQGKMPTYVPPNPNDFASSVDNKLAPEVQQRLRLAADTSKATRPNYLVSNIRRTGKRNL